MRSGTELDHFWDLRCDCIVSVAILRLRRNLPRGFILVSLIAGYSMKNIGYLARFTNLVLIVNVMGEKNPDTLGTNQGTFISGNGRFAHI